MTALPTATTGDDGRADQGGGDLRDAEPDRRGEQAGQGGEAAPRSGGHARHSPPGRGRFIARPPPGWSCPVAVRDLGRWWGCPPSAARRRRAPTLHRCRREIRVAVVAMGVLAALLLLNAAPTWHGRRLAAALLDGRTDMSRADAERLVLPCGCPLSPSSALILALAAWGQIRRGRQAWATLVGAGRLHPARPADAVPARPLRWAPTVASLLLVLLSLTTVTCLLSKKHWRPGFRRCAPATERRWAAGARPQRA